MRDKPGPDRPFVWLLAAVAVAIAGCGDDPDETETALGEGGAGTTTSCGADCPAGCGDGVCSTPGESAASCPADCASCAPLTDVTALIESGELFFGYAVLGTASVTPGCGALAGAKEVAVSLTPGFDGELVLSTQHPSTKIDTVLEVREESCDGAALGCNDEAVAGSPGSRVTIPVAAGAQYVAVVETADDDAGVFALGVHRPGVCEGQGTSEDITAALLTGQRFTADTSASSESQRGGCSNGDANPEVRYTFTAPVTGAFVATTVHPGTTFDTLLYVREAALDGALYCDSVETEIACAADGAPGGAGTLLRFDAQAGRGYELFVDGAGASGEGQATVTLGYAATSPAGLSLRGCDFDAIQDQLAFFVASGQAVYVKVDTVDAATAADTRLRVRTPDGTELYEADDEVDCTFPPPSYGCPEHSFTATTAGLYTVEVYVGSTESCADPSLVNYGLTVTVDGGPSELILIKDQ
jgi:hypothetical protein